jgi:hypothetical protein
MKKRKQKTYKEQTTHAAQQPKKQKGLLLLQDP